MLAYLTFYGPGISPRLWSLWPQMHTVLMEWGIDYWENLLVRGAHHNGGGGGGSRLLVPWCLYRYI